METHHVDSVCLTFAEYVFPRLFVSRRITSLWEAAVAHSATYPYRLIVHIELSALYSDFPHAELRSHRIATISSHIFI